MKVVKRVNPKSSQHKEKNIFCFFFLLYLYEMMDATKFMEVVISQYI